MSQFEDDGKIPALDFSRLEALIYVFGINQDMWKFVDRELDLTAASFDLLMRLNMIIERFNVRDRMWDVLEKRAGFGELSSLDQIGAMSGVTRSRVQQIEAKAVDRILEGFENDADLISILESQSDLIADSLQSIDSISSVEAVLVQALEDCGWAGINPQIIRQLLLALRICIRLKEGNIDKQLPRLTLLACSIPPVIVQHTKIAKTEQERQRQQWEQERAWTYEELAEAVLESAETPLHYMEIIKRAEDLGRRPYVSVKALHNVLFSNTEKFAWVDTGTYGLTAHGHVSVDNYVDIIASVLKDVGKCLGFGDLLHRVDEVRAVKSQTLHMTLDLHPRFYRSQEGTYGLRAWLPTREKQTLRTPAWQVEDKDSFERVAKAVERGYDVESIVAQDKKPPY